MVIRNRGGIIAETELRIRAKNTVTVPGSIALVREVLLVESLVRISVTRICLQSSP